MQEKIGRSALRSNPSHKLPKELLTQKLGNRVDAKEKVLNVLSKADHALNITEISKKAGLSWVTTRTALLELVMLGEVKGFRSGRHTMFKVKE